MTDKLKDIQQRASMKDIQYTVVSMKDFREAIDGDERMLKFAADHLDTPDDTPVGIIVDGQFVTYEIRNE